VAVSFIGGETRVPGETTDMSQVTDKLYHTMLYQVQVEVQIQAMTMTAPKFTYDSIGQWYTLYVMPFKKT
jgi:hypothetical protein